MEQEQHYIKGFNNGYLLAKHEPDLAAKLSSNPNPHSPYFEGLINGKQQYEKEVQEVTKTFSKEPPAKEDREMDLDR